MSSLVMPYNVLRLIISEFRSAVSPISLLMSDDFSQITGESYHIGTTDYAVTRIAECGGLDAYLLKTPEEEIDSQFGVELKRLILTVSEQFNRDADRNNTIPCMMYRYQIGLYSDCDMQNKFSSQYYYC